MVTIHFPEKTTYFICYGDDKKASWGKVEPEQTMSGGCGNLYQTTIQEDWLQELKKYYVVEGYKFMTEERALGFKKQIEAKYKNTTVEILKASNQKPEFWYILGNFSNTPIKPQKFQVFPTDNP